MTIWMVVTKDEYEFPIKMADSAHELAKMCGVSVNTVRGCVFKEKVGLCKSRYKKVEIDDD